MKLFQRPLAPCWWGCLAVGILSARDVSAQRNDENPPISGSMVRYTQNSITLKTNIGERTIEVTRKSEVRVRAPANESFIYRGATVEVHGNVTPKYTIEDARLVVFVGRARPVNSTGGAYFSLKAEKGKPIPAVIIGTVVQTDPLRIKGSNSITSRYYFSDEVTADGNPIRWYDVPSIGKVFQLDLRTDRSGSRQVSADLGNAIQYAGDEPRVTVFLDKYTEVASTIFIDRREPIDLETLGIKQKGKKSRRSKRGKK